MTPYNGNWIEVWGYELFLDEGVVGDTRQRCRRSLCRDWLSEKLLVCCQRINTIINTMSIRCITSGRYCTDNRSESDGVL